jgi:hypothetical protein
LPSTYRYIAQQEIIKRHYPPEKRASDRRR